VSLRLGIVSDTHGLVRPEALALLQGVDAVLHAGDIGKPAVLDQLAAIAPVVAVRGNVDRGEWARALPETELYLAGTLSIYLLHNLQELDLAPDAAGIDLIVHGHSHRPSREVRQGVTYLNPGSIGPRRFTLPIAMGILTVEDESFAYEAHVIG
jgi:putative phosphoesterase